MLKPYMITYDLNSPGQNYNAIIKTIKEECANAWCNYWKSAFLITSALTTSQMIEKLKPYLDKNDRLIIIEVVNNYSGWLEQEQWDWIKKNIF